MTLHDAARIVARFGQQRVLVIGEAMLDCYYAGHAERISPEGPVPVVTAASKQRYPGGATNAAANVAALGGQARCLSVIGADEAGAWLRAELQRRAIGDDLLVDPARATITKLRILADGQYVVRFDEGERRPLTGALLQAFLERLSAAFAACDAVIVADYCYGVLCQPVIEALGALKRRYDRLVLVDSKNLPLYRGMAASVITPNHLEAQHALGWTVRDVEQLTTHALEELGRRLLEQIGTTWALVTLGAQGALLFERDRPTYRIAPRPVERAHVSGAGDTFTAALALALAAGAPVRLAAEIAAEAAAVVVAKPGTATVSAQEVLQRLARYTRQPAVNGDLADAVQRYRRAGRRIVFTNGIFDGLSSAQIAFLQAARRLGDVLIVGINSDRSACAQRGAPPRLAEQERLALVAALDVVDHVLLFDETTPGEIIRAVRPAVHVKGGDYQGAALPELEALREVGGELVILPLLEGGGAWLERKLLRRTAQGATGDSREDA